MSLAYVVNPSSRKKRRRRSRAAKSNPSRHRRRRRSSAVKRNPSRRHRFFGAVSRRRRGYRRNPIALRGIVSQYVVPAAIGAGGAVATKLAFGLLPIPAQLKTGPIQPVARMGVAILIGMLVGKFVNKRVGTAMALGGATVVAADLATDFVQKTFPTLSLGDSQEYPMLEYYDGQNVGALFNDGGMGAVVEDTSVGALFPASEMGDMDLDEYE